MKWAVFQFIMMWFPLVSSFLTERNPFFVRPQVALSAMPETTKGKSKLYPFQEARKIARGHGFSSKEEFVEYSCPGAYQLPKNAEEVWSDEWKGWVSASKIENSFRCGFHGSLHTFYLGTLGGFSRYLS
jgi:hypothetical protein